MIWYCFEYWGLTCRPWQRKIQWPLCLLGMKAGLQAPPAPHKMSPMNLV